MPKSIKNFIIDHVVRGVMTKKNGEYMWSVNEVGEPSLNVTMKDTSQAVDALGNPIMEFDRGREAQFTAANSVFDLGLYAAQMGNDMEVASADNRIVSPSFEDFEVTGEASQTYTLKHVPTANIQNIFLLNGDGGLGVTYKAGTVASATDFVYSEDSHQITIPTGLNKGDVLFVMYEYESEGGVAITADGVNFPKKGKFILEVLGADPCDDETLIHAYLVFPNAKLDGNVDKSWTTDGNHPFTIKALQDYCDHKKRLFTIVIPDEA